MSILNRLRKNEAKAETKKAAPEKVAKEAKATTKQSKAKITASTVIVRPVITEKMTLTGTYAFEVAYSANKSEVMKAVEAVYGVRPETVRVMNVIGKSIRTKKGYGSRKDWKKAIVRLPKGKSINVYEGI